MRIGYVEGIDIKNNVISFPEIHAIKKPNKIAFIDEGGDWGNVTFADFVKLSSQLGHSLKLKGVISGDRVLVHLPISVSLYISIAAIQRIGAIPVFIDSWAEREHINTALANSSPKMVIASSIIAESFGPLWSSNGVKNVIVATDSNGKNTSSFNSLFLNGEFSDVCPVSNSDTALITYTTGSSGSPKGANRTHKFLAAQHYALNRIFPYSEEDVDLPAFPIFALNNVAAGLTTVIPNSLYGLDSKKIIANLVNEIEVSNASCMTLSPALFKAMSLFCLNSKIELNNVGRVLSGGAPISENDVASFLQIAPNAKTWILYGSTEVEPIACIEAQQMLKVMGDEIDYGADTTAQGVVVGKIDEELNCKILDISKDPETAINIDESVGVVGEVVVEGEHVCKEYFNNNEALISTKIKDKNNILWHRTGDIGRMDSKGLLWIVGRMHNKIEIEGRVYFPVRPEIALKEINSVSNSAYLQLERGGEKIIAAVVSVEGDNFESVKKRIRKVFEEKKYPLDKVFLCNEIPMDIRHHSKVDYRSLRERIKKEHG